MILAYSFREIEELQLMCSFKIKAEWTDMCFLKETKWNLGEKYYIKKHYSVFSEFWE